MSEGLDLPDLLYLRNVYLKRAMDLMDVKLKAYYESACEFERELIDWYCIHNKYCPLEYFEYLRDHKIEEDEKAGFESTYFDCRTSEEVYLKEIDDVDIAELDRWMKELDGTLLCDLVSGWMRDHKVFYFAPPSSFRYFISRVVVNYGRWEDMHVSFEKVCAERYERFKSLPVHGFNLEARFGIDKWVCLDCGWDLQEITDADEIEALEKLWRHHPTHFDIERAIRTYEKNAIVAMN